MNWSDLLPAARLAVRSRWVAPLLRFYQSREDAVQDIALHCWERRHKYDPARGSLQMWVMMEARIAMQLGLTRDGSNRGFFRLKRHSTGGFVHLPLRRNAYYERLPVCYDPPTYDDAVDTLIATHSNTPDDPTILRLYSEGYTCREIGERLGRTRRAIKARIALIRERATAA